MIDTNQHPTMIAVDARFALAVLARALDGGEPVREKDEPYLAVTYDEQQGMTNMIADVDRALGEIVEAITDLEFQLKDAREKAA